MASSTAQHNPAREKAGKGARFLSGCYESTLLAPAATAAYPRAALAYWVSTAPTGSANKRGTDDMPWQQLERTSEEDLDKPDSHQGNQFRKPEKPPERQRKAYMCQVTHSCIPSSFIKVSDTVCIFIHPFLSLQAGDSLQSSA